MPNKKLTSPKTIQAKQQAGGSFLKPAQPFFSGDHTSQSNASKNTFFAPQPAIQAKKGNAIQMNGGKGGKQAQQSPKQQALGLITQFQNNTKTKSAFTNISKAKFIKDLTTRVNSPGGMDQGSLNACGPAAFGYIHMQKDIVAFTKFMLELYQTGEGNIGSMHVNPWDGLQSRAPGDKKWPNYKGTKTPKRPNNTADYLFMASIRSHESTIIDQFEDPNDAFSGITLPGTIKKWFKSTGNYTTVKDDTNLLGGYSFAHFQNTVHNKYHSKGHKVVLLIGATMIDISRGNTSSKKNSKKEDLKKGKLGSKSQTSMPNHYVVYEGNLSVSGDMVTFDIWTWGSKETINISKKDFNRLYYGGVYAK